MTARRTVLVGLDGATFSVLDSLVAEGVMPFLGEFIAGGVRAELRTVIPALTPPAWTSLVTGRSPGQHGVFDFFRKEAPHSHRLRFVTAHDIGCETIWSLANQHAMRAIALNFPLTFPPPFEDGYIVPGWMPWRQLRLGCHPDGVYDQLKGLPDFNPRELAMDMKHEEKALEGCDPEEYEDWIAMHMRREQQWCQILELLLDDDEPCELVSVLFDGVDKLQHLFWRFIDPAYVHTLSTPQEQWVRKCCLDYFRELDTLLSQIVHLVGSEATVILVSDHGFGPQERTFFVNAWLREGGHLSWADGVGPQPDKGQTLGVGQIARHGYMLDWGHTKAYAPLPSGNGIHIVRADDEHPNGVLEAEYELFRDQLVADLLEFKDPETGVPVVVQVWKREELFAGPWLELAPDLTLVLQDGGLISILASGRVVRPRPEPSGTHRANGIFVARGPELQQGIQLSELSILDVAPLILYSLGLSLPADLEGELPTQALQPAVLRVRPVERVSRSEPGHVQPTRFETVAELDDESQADLLRRLKALGYIE